ncbi:hypothetical protein FGIG_08732 [Fasciola gigantica]|uniref:Methyltransferase domain-containing protein n=1 Tax=Fasciola gigantica TaxID=46835 RepID=A0A504YHE6_FASGI|nr:hypothetical protein FGIG_08732 [Fasciola gigantica]
MTENRANLSILIHRAAFLIQRFRSLLESYVTTYYCEDGACNLIPEWTKEPGLGLEDLCYLLSGFLPNLATQSTKCRPTRPLPLSLLAYRTACLATQLNVCASDDSSFSDAPTWQHDPILFSNSTILTNLLKPLTELPDAWDSITLKRDKHVVQFRRHLTPKKLHEIDRHSLVIYTLADAIETEKKTAPLVIDIGSGQGHLSRKLSLYHGLRVLNLEVNETHVRKASQFDEKTKSYLRKKIRTASSPSDHPNPEAVLRSPVSLSKRITNSTSSSELSNLISRSEAKGLLPNTSSNQPYSPPLVLLNGLHACGDLSTTVLRLFTEMDRACCAITVGCCYMKITATEIEDELTNIRGTRRCPQSSQQLWHPKSHCLQHYSLGLSYGILEAACHSIGDYLGRLRRAVDSGNQDHLLVHGYRALFELLMKRRCSSLSVS